MHGTIELDNRRVCACGGPKHKEAKRCLSCATASPLPIKGSRFCLDCGGPKSSISVRYCATCYAKHLGDAPEPAYISPWIEEPDGTRSRYVTGGVVTAADVYAMRLVKGRRKKPKTRGRHWIGTTVYLRPIGPPPRPLPEYPKSGCDEVRPYIDKVREIIHAVCIEFDVSVQDITGPSRVWKVIVPRQIAHALAKHLTNRSMPDIGRRCGGRDHTTIWNSFQKMEPIIEIVSRKMTPESTFLDWVRAMRPYAEEMKQTGRKKQTLRLPPSIKVQPQLPFPTC